MLTMNEVMELLANRGQGHVVDAAMRRPPSDRLRYCDTVLGIDLEGLLDSLDAAILAQPKPSPRSMATPDCVDLENDHLDPSFVEAREVGEAMLARGEVACILVAGGQGTRLGWSGPKGTFPIGPVSDRSLFQLFAESILALQRRFGQSIPWGIMTGGQNHVATAQFFTTNDYFGLSPNTVRLFQQGAVPTFDSGGKIILDHAGEIMGAPDGHGGVFRAMEKADIFAWFGESGAKHVFYFQVDNPLCVVADPVFLGIHAERRAEMSTKVVSKRSATERVGVVAVVDGTLRVIEYLEIPSSVSQLRESDGKLTFRAANTGIHAFSIEFMEYVARSHRLPYHVTKKQLPGSMEINGATVDGWKAEQFVFDALPMARHPSVVHVSRKREFSPVKSSNGQDSPEEAREALCEHYRSMLRSSGVRLSEKAREQPIEISPVVAVDEIDLRRLNLQTLDIDGPIILTHDSFKFSTSEKHPTTSAPFSNPARLTSES
ncbi:MAG: UTP--glucose-1-phosphate uridylyltransferase [Myxococcales bacterium]|nr:UTP--glucose-1-phosphate uridylyltransferase [Myxococcales bacterium]